MIKLLNYGHSNERNKNAVSFVYEHTHGMVPMADNRKQRMYVYFVVGLGEVYFTECTWGDAGNWDQRSDRGSGSTLKQKR